MTTLPNALYRADQVRELDRIAIEEAGLPGALLMARAGEAAFAALRSRWPAATRLAVVCGGGNNGGDGYVVARLACQAGLVPQLFYLTDPAALRGDARGAAEAARAAGVAMAPFGGDLPPCDLVVDGVLGTGLKGAVEGAMRAAIEAVNRSGRPVVALDLPSGLAADSGRVLGAAVEAALTVSFIGLKLGLLTGEGPAHTGELLFADLGVPPEIYRLPPAALRYGPESLARFLPPRRRTAHKGDAGHVLVVGGEHGMAGAARIAAEAAARSGAGLTSLATRAAHAPVIAAARPELMVHGVESAAELEPLLARADVVALGPGLGRGEWGRGLLARLLEAGKPLVLDADALNLLAESPRPCPDALLTPHPGEAARLLGVTVAEVQADRPAAALALRERFGAVALLKGAGTLVAAPSGLALCQAGNPGMASGGMGDLLTGVVAALIAQGLAPEQAAIAGACLHGAAGDAAAAEGGERGLLALDLMPHLRRLANP